MMTTTSSSSKPIRHSKILSGSLELSDAEMNGHTGSNHHSQHKIASKKHHNKTLLDTTQFDSKSFIHKSDGFNQRSINFGISKSDKSLEKTGLNVRQSSNVVPILIVSKSKKLINKYNQHMQRDADSAKKNYMKSLNQELKLPGSKYSPSNDLITQTNSQYFTDREDFPFQSPKQVNNQMNHFTNSPQVSHSVINAFNQRCVLSSPLSA